MGKKPEKAHKINQKRSQRPTAFLILPPIPKQKLITKINISFR